VIPWKKQIFSLVKRVYVPSHTLFQHLHFHGIFQVQVEDKFFKLQHYGYQIENEIFWQGLKSGWEKVSLQLWTKLCKTHHCILDIGANTGVYALIAKTVHPEAKVFAFEPVQRVFEKLQRNIYLNQFDIKAYEKAVSNEDGAAIIYDQLTEHIYSVTVNKNLSANQQVREVTIQTVTLASFIEKEKLDFVDLIKIDVETHEPEVLEGMGEYLTKFKPTLLIEILTEEVAKRVEDIVKNCEYLYFDIDEKGLPKQTFHIGKSSYYNYLLCSKETALSLSLIT